MGLPKVFAVYRWVDAMLKVVKRTSRASIATLVLAFAFVAPSASATSVPTRALPCHASMSNYHPEDYTTVTVRVRTAPFAHVTTVAHYRTENTTKHRQANSLGRAHIPYYISGATPGFRVVVNVTVRKGTRKGSCRTSFTPTA